MSLSININKLNDEQRKKILNDLTFIKDNEQEFYAFNVDEVTEDLVVPYNYGFKDMKIKKPKKDQYPLIDVEFKGELRDTQKEVRKEVIDDLNKQGTSVLSLPTGGGKCHARNTKIMMYDGSLKRVQHIKGNDKLMGDDSKPRTVSSICRGIETIYKIKDKECDGFSYKVNESHILTLWDRVEKRVVDIPLRKVLEHKPNRFYGIKTKVYFPTKNVNIDPYTFGVLMTQNIKQNTFYTKVPNIAKRVYKKHCVSSKNNYHTVTDLKGFNKYKHLDDFIYNNSNIRKLVLSGVIDLVGKYIAKRGKQYYKITLLDRTILKKILFMARTLGINGYFTNRHTIKLYGKELYWLPLTCLEKRYVVLYYKGLVVKDYQFYPISIKKLKPAPYYGFTIDKNQRYLLENTTITHNTITSINITTKIGLKTLVVVNRILLLDQWKESIEKFSNGQCQILKPGKKINKDLDYYIINGQNINKIDPDFLKTIGFVIIDELHLLMTETIIKNLLYIRPKYFLGLSATPYRSDSFDDVINKFFSKSRVVRKLNKAHTVYRINTKFVPEVEKDFRGKIIWNSVLNSQAFSPERNQIIINIITKFKDRNTLVLVKRIEHGKYILNELNKIGIKADSLLGTQKYKETDNNVLIGTVSKCGTGFDCPKLDTLIVAADLASYFIQSLGRIFRKTDNNPIVFDLVDDNNVLKAHWAERRKVYLEHGGNVKYFDKEFKDIVSSVIN